MPILKKINGAVTYWTSPDERRAGALPATVVWGNSMGVVGVVFLALVCSGTFPGPVPALQAAGLFVPYTVKYALYIISGILAVLAVRAAHSALAEGRPTTSAKLLLVPAVATVLASACISIAMIVKHIAGSPHGGYPTPQYVYVINVVIIILRILFASILTLALVTLFEADRNPSVADMALAGFNQPYNGKLPVTFGPQQACGPSGPCCPQPAATAAAAPAGMMSSSAMPSAAQVYPAADSFSFQKPAPVAVGYPAQPVLLCQQQAVSPHVLVQPADLLSSPIAAYRQQRREQRRQQHSLVGRFLA